MNEGKQKKNNLREGQGNQNDSQRESWSSNGSYPHRERWHSGESMKQGNCKQKENGYSNGGNPWNCLKGMSR